MNTISGSISFGPNGGGVSSSKCGADFDAYVGRHLEPFPYDPMAPARREIDNLWQGRKLRVFTRTSERWRRGCVSGFSQFNMGPYAPTTNWSVRLGLESIVIQDVVEVQRLQTAGQYNGKKGIVQNFREDTGRFQVKIQDEIGGRMNGKIIGVMPSNIKQPVEYQCSIIRMNVKGGGSLGPIDRLISLEWLEPPSPQIDLSEGTLISNCPTCRAAEPTEAAFARATSTKMDECPVCLEKKDCRVLTCNHLICQGCWSSWRRTSSLVPGRFNEMDAQELETERSRRYEELMAVLPHTMYTGEGRGTTPEDSKEDIARAEKLFFTAHQLVMRDLIQFSHRGESALVEFRKEVMVVPIGNLVATFNLNAFKIHLSMGGLVILMNAIEDRLDEVQGYLDAQASSEFVKKVYDQTSALSFFHFQVACDFCNFIGEKYEKAKNYRSAIPWYERDVAHARQIATPAKRLSSMVTAYCNLGLAQKRAGFLRGALKSYDAGIALGLDNRQHFLKENRETLLEEMDVWKGSSGQLPPGC